MSGHNKWSKIKHKKAATDAQKSKIFGKLVRLIQVEAKKSGGDVNAPGLKTAIEKARKENMPNDNIDRAIKKASESGDMTPVLYEAYGPGGVGIIITGLTDNNNRTSQEIKHLLSKNGASLGASGSVAWNFSQNEERDWIPNTTIEIDDETGEKLEALIETLEEHDDVQDVYYNAE
ncbi:MAG: YebC/PmpR family DNA-binding transcriptional regulator [Candidatus Pacebacteria bacterium]|nr:YebC/PmpR family DNA-binding transcriptional regulator [Candidatus Paceibacterota bacterium]